ncbi:hypothetical protein ACIXNM_13355 [Bacteroides fragilis]
MNQFINFRIKRNSYYEIYLLQGIIFLLLGTVVENRLIFFIVAVATTIISSLGMNWVNQKIIALINIRRK